MTIKAYTWGIRFITILSLAAFVFVVKFIDPLLTGVIGKALFYLSLFFVLSGIFNLFLLRLRRKSVDTENAAANIGLSFRQGILLACFAIGLLILQSLRMLVWWDGLLLLAGIFLIEFYFVSRS